MLFAGMVIDPLLIFTFWSLSDIREPIKFINLRVGLGLVNDPLSGKHYSLPFLPAIPLSLSRTYEGLFDLTWSP